MPQMKWASSVSDKKTLRAAVDEAVRDVQKQLDGARPDFLAAFVSRSFADAYEEASARLLDKLPAKVFTGCGAGGVIGAGREMEGRPAVSLVAASLPDVTMRPFAVQDEDMPDLDASPRAWEELLGVRAADDPQFLVLADPFSIRADTFLLGLDYAFPKAAKIGGLASGGGEPHQNALFLDNICLRSGLAGVAFMGNLRVETLVAQGCRPLGPNLKVTESRQNVLISVDGKSPIQRLQEIAGTLSAKDRSLMETALFLGLSMDATNDAPDMGDFLIRNIVGIDRERGYLAVGALPRPGQTVRFHVRDAHTSAEDLQHLLDKAVHGRVKPEGALMFSCMGRGRDLYGEPDVDSHLFQRRFGATPVGGFFCNGEIGPVHGSTYLHGYTSCFGLFGPRKT